MSSTDPQAGGVSTHPRHFVVPGPNEELAASVNEALTAPGEPLHDVPEGEDGVTATPAGPQPVILTPSRLRIDSRVLIAHSTSQWLLNCVFAILILLKLGGPLQGMSWWSTFAPTWISHAALTCLQIFLLYVTVSKNYCPCMGALCCALPRSSNISPSPHAEGGDLQAAWAPAPRNRLRPPSPALQLPVPSAHSVARHRRDQWPRGLRRHADRQGALLLVPRQAQWPRVNELAADVHSVLVRRRRGLCGRTFLARIPYLY